MYSLIITGAPEVGPMMVEQIRKGDSLSQGFFPGLLFAHTLCPSPRDSPSPLDSWKHNCRSQEAQAACRRSKHFLRVRKCGDAPAECLPTMPKKSGLFPAFVWEGV